MCWLNSSGSVTGSWGYTRAICKVRRLAAVCRCYVEEAVTVMPSCSDRGNVVVA
jgi:hypothetical protein